MTAETPKTSVVRISSPPRAELTPQDYVEAARRKRAQREAMEVLNAARSRGITPVMREAKDAKREAFSTTAMNVKPGPTRVWVEGFRRKDGTRVEGHWRTNPSPAKPPQPKTHPMARPKSASAPGEKEIADMSLIDMASPTGAVLVGAAAIKALYDGYKTVKAYTDAIRGKRPLTYTIRPDGTVAPYSDQAAEAGKVLAEIAVTKGLPAAVARSAVRGIARDRLNTFIGPEGAENLAKAGLRHPDDWGGINRLAAAKQAWGKGKGDEEVWREFGWTRANTWGPWNQGDQPATVIADNRVALKPLSPGQHGGSLKDFIDADELFVAEPRSAMVPTVVTIREGLTHGGATRPYESGQPKKPEKWPRMSSRQRAMWLDANRPRLLPRDIDVTAPVADRNLLETLMHETQHTVQMFQNVPTVHMEMLGYMLHGTEAQRLLALRVRDVENQLLAIKASPQPDWEQIFKLNELLSDLKWRMDRSATHARYLDVPWERQAREGHLRRRMTLEENREVVPGKMDVYAPEAFPGLDYAGTWGLPPSAFRPPKK
jgi:hypothetical protein